MTKTLFTAALLIGAAATAFAQGTSGPPSMTQPPPQSKASSAAEPKAKKPKKMKAAKAPMGSASASVQ